ncbi:MAG: glycosyltransferase [Streptococcaceae bacterium]|jgi:glycosyltransferase involved in cell wall biosynthesis|nr:glycosyltransferase [Streptococcaceae bacterium]
MKFSVIIPAFNAEKTIEKCLESLAAQSYTDFEVLVIDDGSRDQTKERASVFPFVHVFTQPHKGVSAARNLGLEAAVGDYIVFIDADDWVSPEHLALLAEAVKSDMPLCIFNSFFVKSDKSLETLSYGCQKTHVPVAEALELILSATKYQGWPFNKAFRRDLLQQTAVKFDEDIFYSEDTLFITEFLVSAHALAPDAHVTCLNQPSYHYTPGRATRQLDAKFLTLLDAQAQVSELTSSFSSRLQAYNRISQTSGLAAVYREAVSHNFLTSEVAVKFDKLQKHFIRELLYGMTHSPSPRKAYQFLHTFLAARKLAKRRSHA